MENPNVFILAHKCNIYNVYIYATVLQCFNVFCCRRLLPPASSAHTSGSTQVKGHLSASTVAKPSPLMQLMTATYAGATPKTNRWRVISVTARSIKQRSLKSTWRSIRVSPSFPPAVKVTHKRLKPALYESCGQSGVCSQNIMCLHIVSLGMLTYEDCWYSLYVC